MNNTQLQSKYHRDREVGLEVKNDIIKINREMIYWASCFKYLGANHRNRY